MEKKQVGRTRSARLESGRLDEAPSSRGVLLPAVAAGCVAWILLPAVAAGRVTWHGGLLENDAVKMEH